MVIMSLKQYIENKSKNVDIIYDIREYESNLRDHCLGLESKKSLYEYYLDLQELSKDLEFYGYPEKFRLLLNFSNPSNLSYVSSFEDFFDWSVTKKSKYIRKLEEKLVQLKSFYIFDESVELKDIDYVVKSKCDSICEKFKILDLYINEAVKESSFNESSVKVKILTESVANLIFSEDIITLKIQENIPILVSENISEKNKFFLKQLFSDFFHKNYFDFYIHENYLLRNELLYFKRKFYLNKNDQYFYFPLLQNKPFQENKKDIWKIKLKLNQIIYKNENFRLKDNLQRVRYLELEETHAE